MSRTRTRYEIERDALSIALAQHAVVLSRLRRAEIVLAGNSLTARAELPSQADVGGMNSTEVAHEVARLDAGIRAAESAVAAALASQRREAFGNALDAAREVVSQPVQAPRLAPRERTHRRARSAPSEVDTALASALERAAPTVERVLSRVPASTTDEALGKIDEMAALMGRATSEDEVDRVVMALRVAVDAAIAAASVVEDQLSWLDGWTQRLYFLPEQEHGEVHERVRRLDPGDPWPDALSREIDELVSEAERIDARTHALAATRAALESLGYAVSDDFIDESLGRDGSFAGVPASSEHRLRVRERRGQLLLNVVRSDGEPDPEIDLAVEQDFCDILPGIHEAAGAAGIGLAMESQLADGDLDVVYSAPALAQDARNRSAKQRLRKKNRSEQQRRR